VPHGKPSLQLVRCAAAVPRPQPSSGYEEATTERAGRGSFGYPAQPGKRLAVGKKPTVTVGTVTALGALSTAEAATLIRARLPELTNCYTLDSKAPTRAVVSYKITIASDGSVAYVDAPAGGLYGTVDSCARRVLRSIKAPAKGSSTTIQAPLVFDSTGSFAVPDKDEPDPASNDPWTPFAIGSTTNAIAATGAARVTEAVLRTRLAKIDDCFAKSTATGSLRLLFEIDLDGLLGSVRAGGIGDRDGEACAAKALAGMRVMTPQQEHVEVACDLARGDAAPWRLSTAGGYDVIDVETLQLRHGTETLAPGSGDAEALPSEIYVVIAKPETPGGMLQLALMWARDATGILLAVADGKPAPLFLGMGNATGSVSDDDGSAIRPALRVGGKEAIGCIGKTTHKAPVANAVEVSGILQKLAARCHQIKCSPTLVVAIDSDAMTRDLVEVSGAARRAGFDRVLFGGPELGCSGEPTKAVEEPEFDPDLE
jgi:hypothetical protein